MAAITYPGRQSVARGLSRFSLFSVEIDQASLEQHCSGLVWYQQGDCSTSRDGSSMGSVAVMRMVSAPEWMGSGVERAPLERGTRNFRLGGGDGEHAQQVLCAPSPIRITPASVVLLYAVPEAEAEAVRAGGEVAR